MSQTMIHLQLQVRNCIAEVWLNGIPLKRLDSHRQTFVTLVAHSFLIQELNRIELVVFPGPTPTQARQGRQVRTTADAFARVRLVRFQVGMFADADGGETLGEIRWQGTDTNDDFPKILERRLRIDSDFGDWSWLHAERLTGSDDLRQAVEVVHFVQRAFRDGRAHPILRLARVFLSEETRSLPVYQEGELAKGLAESIAGNAGRENWVEDLRNESFDLRLCADDRLVECVDSDWRPLVRTKPQPSGDEYPFPMFLGRIRNEWLILR